MFDNLTFSEFTKPMQCNVKKIDYCLRPALNYYIAAPTFHENADKLQIAHDSNNILQKQISKTNIVRFLF